MSRCGRRGTGGQVGAGAPGGVVVAPLRTVASVQAKLAGTVAGTRCVLSGTGDIVIGVWISDGVGSYCEHLNWDEADGTEFTVGTADTFDIQIDTGSSIDWTAGLKPLPGTETKILPICAGVKDASKFNTATAKYSQSNPGAALVDGVFYGVGALLPRGGTPLVTFAANHYLAGNWACRTGINLWPTPAFSGAVTITNDAAGELVSFRAPRADGTSIQSTMASSQNGDTTGPLVGASPTLAAATDGWSQFSMLNDLGMFYKPLTSGQEVVFHDFRVLTGGDR